MLLIRLSGHSGAGKSRLLAALLKRNVRYPRAVLYTSRQSRDGEVHGKDYFFLSREAIEKLPPDKFFIGPVREMLQAVDLEQLERDLRTNDMVIIEIFHELWPELEATMKSRLSGKLATASIFLTAIDPDRLRHISDNEAAEIIKHEVKRILEWRAKDPADKILKRSESAVSEIINALRNREHYDKILFSSPEGPDGEDDWTKCEKPINRAAQTIDEFLSLIQGDH